MLARTAQSYLRRCVRYLLVVCVCPTDHSDFMEVLGQLLPLEQRGEGVAAAVRDGHLLHLDGVVGQEVVHDVGTDLAVHLVVRPLAVETKSLA